MRADLMETTLDEIASIGATTESLIGAMKAEQVAIRARDEHKDALVNALVGNANPLTSKAHSLTSAGEAAEKDETYRTLDSARKDAAYEVLRAHARLDMAKHYAHLATTRAAACIARVA